jgi:DnaJ-class molecular chaperone
MNQRCHHVPRPERIFDEAECALCRRYIKAVTCRKCEGTGVDESGKSLDDCSQCKGRGVERWVLA